MKNLLVTIAALVIALAMIVPVAFGLSAAPAVVGQVVAFSNGSAPGFSGDIQLLSDGTISGQWEWNVFNYSGYGIRFWSDKWETMSFPDGNTAVFSGTFSSRDLPIDFRAHNMTCEFSFEITEVPDPVPPDIGTPVNPKGFPDVVPPGIILPPGYSAADTMNDLMRVYCDGQLIAEETGDFQVTVVNR